jgi:hypothetical protein
MSKASFGLAGLVIIAATAFSACPPSTDRGRRCVMPKRTDAGVAFITEREVRARTGTGANATRDFLAFGSLDCDSLLCVRDATFASDAGEDDPAAGYCSNPCDIGAACPSFDPRLDERGDTRLNCRALLLDEQTLEAINQDPSAREILPVVRTPYFCARGAAPDAGM